MFNCYCVMLAGGVFAIFQTEQACENFIRMYSERNHPAPVMTIEGRYIPNVGF